MIIISNTSTQSFEVFMNNEDDIARIPAQIQNEGWIEQFWSAKTVVDTVNKIEKNRG